METLDTLASTGLALPSPAYLLGVILFSMVGYAAYRYGKKAALPYPKWIGVALMLYPYVVSRTSAMYLVGGALCVALYVFRA